MPGLLIGPEPPEEPLAGRLIIQGVGGENCAANPPEIFPGAYLPSGVGPSGDHHIPTLISRKVINIQFCKMVFHKTLQRT